MALQVVKEQSLKQEPLWHEDVGRRQQRQHTQER